MATVKSKQQREPSFPVAFVLALLANLLLVFVPLPIGPMRRRLVGYSRQRNGGRDIVFYCHPGGFVCTAHLIWVGWLVAAVGAYNAVTTEWQWWVVPMQPLYWIWVGTLLLTIIVLGIQFNAVACGYLIAGTLTLLTGALLVHQRVETELLGEFYAAVEAIPMGIAWGVPAVVSFVLGVVFANVCAWRTLNSVWVLPYDENYIEEHQFLRRAWSRSLGALNFEATTLCLIRRFLNFGYGDIIIRLATGAELVTVRGVFFAEQTAALMRRRVAVVRGDLTQTSDNEQAALQDGAVDDNEHTDADFDAGLDNEHTDFDADFDAGLDGEAA